ncbi:DNA internalization-related competence protein ComEC/Rec2 [Allopusillimonas soli]|uniref:DNA internalization-related competence protein ComEC/Rec2 n=1 Tax=Allopusillimonas soli TaxID=659016 RepID=A0A853FA95_9BURK|nr:DNA internalization-related competence protein ComEC/Rec2 [Allopusillimonas soli]NYT36542.1 DNA internalization-related competence protein ComEC/Rec2 [Allopusillimonas soli]TEA75037.1 DNA internalization-related competence protein ComEC/Rec2 [Allopusillimonas soli]
MVGRCALVALVGGCWLAHVLPAMPQTRELAWMAAALLLPTALVAWWPVRRARCLVLAGWLFCIGLALTVMRIEYRLSDALEEDNENQVSRVTLRIASLPRLDAGRRQFEADVLHAHPDGVPRRILVTWGASDWRGPYGAPRKGGDDFPVLRPGEVWRMALVLRPVYGARNLQGYDYEGHLFAQGVRASGTVRGRPQLLRDEPWADLPTVAQRARHYVRAALLPHIEIRRYGGVLLALAIGDQAAVPAGDWQIFNRSGITHLVSISGSHVTMVAALAGVSVLWLWRRVRWGRHGLAERVPARLAASWSALLVAWLYCLLAGWGVPARRTFFMLAIVALAYGVRLPISGSRILCLAAAVVVMLDPWALLSSGFWLSFGAVAVLFASRMWLGISMRHNSAENGLAAQDIRHASYWVGLRASLVAAARLQLSVTLALTPILAVLFHEVSAVSPLANAYAIPVIGLFVTPVALLAAAAACVPGLSWLAQSLVWLGHLGLEAVMAPTAWLASLPVASFAVAAAPWWITALAVAGAACILMPYGAPFRRMGWLLLVPALCWRPARPPEGGWALHALDVGQAGAVVVLTARHTLLFDTGARRSPESEDGSRIIVPFLRAQGVRSVDTLVVSHADIDHAGGLRGVLANFPVKRSYAPFDIEAHMAEEARKLQQGAQRQPGKHEDALALPLARDRCMAGMAWTVDGVRFEFLWPAHPARDNQAMHKRSGRRNERNHGGCVLHIKGRHHAALLTGDIGALQEQALVRQGLAATDLVMAPHHGSASSSSEALIQATNARHAVAQAARWSRHGHPSPLVQARWEDSGAVFWRTDLHGSIHANSSAKGLDVRSARQMHRRRWDASPVNLRIERE